MTDGDRTKLEQETIFRWDAYRRHLECGTTDPRVAARWRAYGVAVRVLSHTRGGEACSWSASLPYSGRRWAELFERSLGTLTPSRESGLSSRTEEKKPLPALRLTSESEG